MPVYSSEKKSPTRDVDMSSVLVIACILAALHCIAATPDAALPLSLSPGDVVSGTPLLHDILDFDNQVVKNATFSFWISSNKTLSHIAVQNEILQMGTTNSALSVRFNRIFCQTRNTPWHKGTPISMGYSRFDETWVHFGVTIENGLWISYLDGFPTGELEVDNAFRDNNIGQDIGFVAIPTMNKEGKPNEFRIANFLFDKTVWSPTKMRDHVLATAPEGAKLAVTHAYEQGFGPMSDRDVFRKEYLFGPMPPPYSLPRLLFSKDDIPDVRAMFTANDRMKMHMANAEAMVADLLENRREWLAAIPHRKDSTDNDAHEIGGLLFSSILVDNKEAHQLLADATMRIIRHKKARIETAAARSNDWELAGLPNLYHKDGLAVMLDLSGPLLTLAEIKEGLAILSIGAKGRRAIYSLHVTSDPFEKYAETRKYATMRRGSNRDVWEGSTLATVQLLLHGHDGLHDPNDIYANYNMFQEQIRKTMSAKGVSGESAGKTALWRGFLPWIMLARHRVPGVDNPIWNLPRIQQFASAKQMQLTPPASIVADHGTWGRGLPRETWSAFFTLLDGTPTENKHNAWLSRLVDPYKPMKVEHVRRLLKEKGTGLLEGEGYQKSPIPLLFFDENNPVKPVFSFKGSVVGFKNSDRSCVVLEQPLDVQFSDNWAVSLTVETKSDGSTDGRLGSFYTEEDSESTALHMHISEGGKKLTLQVGSERVYSSLNPDTWQRILVARRGLTVSINGNDGVPFSHTGQINFLFGSFTCLHNRLGANQMVSMASLRDIRVYVSGLRYRWNEFPRSSFGRVLREPVSLISLLDHRHWSDGIEYSVSPSTRLYHNLFDESTGNFAFSRSTSALSSAVFIYSLDTSGGHVFKSGGHFDVFGLGTGWLFVESRMPVFADNYNSILVDGAAAPGIVEAEQGVYVRGDVGDAGSWVEMDLTWFYRHDVLIHKVNQVGYDESEALPSGGINVKQARRTVSSVNIGPSGRTVTVVSDYISMRDDESHTYTWLGQAMERHGVRFDLNASQGLLDIWLDGDADVDFTGEERKDAPLTVHGLTISDQFSASYSQKRKCLIRVLHANDATTLRNEVRERFRHELYGQSRSAAVFDAPQGEFTHRIAKQLRLETKGTEGRFVIAVYPMAHGERMPWISWSSSREQVIMKYNGVRRKVLSDGSVR